MAGMSSKLIARQEHAGVARQSWRDWIKVDPAADLIPLDEAHLDRIGEQIAKEGTEVPIVLFHYAGTPQPNIGEGFTRPDQILKAVRKGQLVLGDGRSRLEALQRWRRKHPPGEDDDYETVESLVYRADIRWDVRPEAAAQLVDTLNVSGRRHLTVEQRREIAAALIKADSSKSDRRIAAESGLNRTAVGVERKKLEQQGDVSISDTRADSLGRQQPASRTRTAAKITSVTKELRVVGYVHKAGPADPEVWAEQASAVVGGDNGAPPALLLLVERFMDGLWAVPLPDAIQSLQPADRDRLARLLDDARSAIGLFADALSDEAAAKAEAVAAEGITPDDPAIRHFVRGERHPNCRLRDKICGYGRCATEGRCLANSRSAEV